MSKVAPSFPLLRDDQSVEELAANIEYCNDMKKRMDNTIEKIDMAIARDKLEIFREIRELERHILITKIKEQPFYGEDNTTDRD